MNYSELQSEIAKHWIALPEAAPELNKADLRILRLALLRKFSRGVHAQISHSLVHQDLSPKDLEDLEKKLEKLVDNPLNAENFPELLKKLPSLSLKGTSPRPPSLPSALLDAIGPGKLARRDRLWEKALALAAWERNWTFWSLEAEVPLKQIEAWNDALERKLWPCGIVLFVETGQPGSQVSPSGHWRGRWIIVNAPGRSDPWNIHLESTPFLRWKSLP